MVVLVIQLLAGLGLVLWPFFRAFFQGPRSYGDSEPNPIPAIASALVGLVIMVSAFGWTQIDPGWVGVVATQGRVEETELQPGVSWRTPFLTSVTEVDTRLQTYGFQGIEAFTLEQQPALLAGVVQYAVQPDRASDLVKTVGLDYVNKLIVPLADERLKENARQFRTDQITSERTRLGELTLLDLQQALEDSPIDTIGVVIQNVGLSPEYLAAVEKRQQASIEQERIVTEAETARQRAQGEADAQVLRATGQAESNRVVAESLSPELIQWEAINKLNPNVNIMMVPAEQGVLINMEAPTPTPNE